MEAREKVDMRELLELDQKLFPKLPQGGQAEWMMPMAYALGHKENQMNEMNVIRRLNNQPVLPLSTDTILLLYGELVKGSGERAEYKRENNYIESRNYLYVPASADMVEEEMDKLCQKYGYLTAIVPEQAEDILKFLLEFICIHPFANGNGRLSALLVQWLLKKTGYQCAFYLPYDIVMHRIRASEYQREIIRASGCFYGMKPYEFEPFIAHQKTILRQSYETLEAAVRKL